MATAPFSSTETRRCKVEGLNAASLKQLEDIDAWQKAREHSKAACAATGEDAFRRDFGGAALTNGNRFALAEHPMKEIVIGA